MRKLLTIGIIKIIDFKIKCAIMTPGILSIDKLDSSFSPAPGYLIPLFSQAFDNYTLTLIKFVNIRVCSVTIRKWHNYSSEAIEWSNKAIPPNRCKDTYTIHKENVATISIEHILISESLYIFFFIFDSIQQRCAS